jgi:hypothetical protein
LERALVRQGGMLAQPDRKRRFRRRNPHQRRAPGWRHHVEAARPLVYFAGLSYPWPRSRQVATEIEPGDTLGVRLGSILAASPDASVNLGLSLGFVGATRLDGERVPDSDTVLGSLQIGFGAVLSRSVLLNLSGDFRVTG